VAQSVQVIPPISTKRDAVPGEDESGGVETMLESREGLIVQQDKNKLKKYI
jgi:hypothetical protein